MNSAGRSRGQGCAQVSTESEPPQPQLQQHSEAAAAPAAASKASSSSAQPASAALTPTAADGSFKAQPMDADCRELLRRHFESRINRKAEFQLVAAFTVVSGEVLAYAAYIRRDSRGGTAASPPTFQLTERRRRIVRTHYSRSGQLNLLLYVNQADSEHYMPLGYITRDCKHQCWLRRGFEEAAAAAAASSRRNSNFITRCYK